MPATNTTSLGAICLAIAAGIFISGCASKGGTDSTQVSASTTADDPNFIAAPNLTPQQFDKLWGVALNKCFDFGYSAPNSDKTTKNLVCTTQNQGDTMTMRVRFADTGIFVGLQSSSFAWQLMGMSLGPKTKEHQEMRAALRAALATDAK